MEFETRYKNLNAAQQQAVDHIDGPLMVIAGPGTGKTELLSMRVANILKKTDTLPRNILCLTFTESGAEAMRTRLAAIVGPSAYEVAIHTFHSFGSEIISSNREYFYRGAQFQPADDIAALEILTRILDELDHTNQLTSKMNGEYTYLKDIKRAISELKRSGLTSEELLTVLDAGDSVVEALEPTIAEIFTRRVSLTMLPALSELSQKAAAMPRPDLPRGIAPLNHTFAISLAHAIDEAEAEHSTKPITAWKDAWTEKNQRGERALKDHKRHDRLRQLSFVYYRYLIELERAGLYDFDDMILSVIQAIEHNPDLKANLQEQFQYVLVDEFQDTNLAQARLLLNLVDNPINEGAPNLMTVGDDDQAIYSFQGAEVGNMMQFLQLFSAMQKIILTDNYRSAAPILNLARDVITLGEDRLENFDDSINKTLTPHAPEKNARVEVIETTTKNEQYAAIADAIASQITDGALPESIAILARKHAELEAIVPYLAQKGIYANYERQNNLLDTEIVRTLELLSDVLRELHLGHIDHADERMPELLSHPALAIDPKIIWQLSLKASREKRSWSELLAVTPELASLHDWLIASAVQFDNVPTEQMIDIILGTTEDSASPFRDYFFGETLRHNQPEKLLENIQALTQLRDRLHSHLLTLESDDARNDTAALLEFLELYRRYDQKVPLLRPASSATSDMVQLMTAHKAKGLEFDHVYVINTDDRTWGAKVRSASSKISYPHNLPLAPHTGSRDEQIRLLYVTLTRAKISLHLSHALANDSQKPQSQSDLLLVDATPPSVTLEPKNLSEIIDEAEQSWQARLLSVPQTDLKTLLAPVLERYKLSATHINNFIDITRGGPQYFLLQNLLRLPQSRNPQSVFGTAMHEALQRAHTHMAATGTKKPIEDSLHDFETIFSQFALESSDHDFYLKKGIDALEQFLTSPYADFSDDTKAEYDFASQSVTVDGARLTGKIDVARIDPKQKSIAVVDYKTGKASTSWRGHADYDKVKLHKYRQQLMFYRMLFEYSRDFSGYAWTSGAIQFVEPDQTGDIAAPLSADFTDDEYARFKQLVASVWQSIQTLDLPDISAYSADYAGVLAFEQDLIDKSTES